MDESISHFRAPGPASDPDRPSAPGAKPPKLDGGMWFVYSPNYPLLFLHHHSPEKIVPRTRDLLVDGRTVLLKSLRAAVVSILQRILHPALERPTAGLSDARFYIR